MAAVPTRRLPAPLQGSTADNQPLPLLHCRRCSTLRRLVGSCRSQHRACRPLLQLGLRVLQPQRRVDQKFPHRHSRGQLARRLQLQRAWHHSVWLAGSCCCCMQHCGSLPQHAGGWPWAGTIALASIYLVCTSWFAAHMAVCHQSAGGREAAPPAAEQGPQPGGAGEASSFHTMCCSSLCSRHAMPRCAMPCMSQRAQPRLTPLAVGSATCSPAPRACTLRFAERPALARHGRRTGSHHA